ncbi:MAG: hypothetical protein ABJE66_01685 [Deltaproteobacteria bacterium]
MSKKRPERPERTERRAQARDARELVRDRERLAKLVAGGASDHPIEVASAAVVEGRVGTLPCPQCAGEYRLIEHRSEGPGLRAVDVACRQCGVKRTLWFRIVVDEPN